VRGSFERLVGPARVLVVVAASLLAIERPASGAAADKPWDQILRPQSTPLPPPRDGLEVSIELPTHRKEVAKTQIKWEPDLRAGLAVAKRENRPVFVTFRCLPCKSCSEFDKTVLEGGPDLNPLFLQFVTVRLTSTKDVDLRLLPMPQFQDLDVSWWSWFLSPDGRVYGVFGGRDAAGDQSRTSKAALVNAMNRVLAHHYDPRRPAWDVDGPAPEADGKAATPVDLPGFGSWLKVRRNAETYAQQNCVHCHQTSEILRQGEIDAGRFDKRRDLQVWPFPENVGVEVDRDDGLKVTAVTADSPAAKAGLRAGDRLGAAGGRALFGQADFRGVLHRAPLGATSVDVRWLRDDKVMAGTLDLPDGWRKTDISWRASVVEGNVGAAPGFWPVAVADPVRRKLDLSPDTMAVKPLVGAPKGTVSPAAAAGLKGDDVIVAVNGESPNLINRPFLAYFRMKFEPGDEVVLTVKGADGEERKVTYRPGR
jgi:hypothetical protein